MTDPLDIWPENDLEASKEHAMCRYTAVTGAVIDALQVAYAAGRDLSRVIPGVDAITGAVVVAESLEADALLNSSAQALITKPLDDLSDWTLAVLAEILLQVSREMADSPRLVPGYREMLQSRAWTALERTLDSPTASPMLWYQDIYLDVAQEYQRRGDPRALTMMKRGLAHCLCHNEGDNAEPFLRDIAEVFLWLGKFDEALSLYTAMIRNEPNNIWHYNSIALTFVDSGLARLGVEASERGLSLISATGDPERLEGQFRNSLARLVADTATDRVQDIEPTILIDFRNSLKLGFDVGLGCPYPMLAHELVPDVSSMPVKGPAEMPTLPSTSAQRPEPSTQRHEAPSRAQSLKRNEPCWCGSGKKYKNCHMRADRYG